MHVLVVAHVSYHTRLVLFEIERGPGGRNRPLASNQFIVEALADLHRVHPIHSVVSHSWEEHDKSTKAATAEGKSVTEICYCDREQIQSTSQHSSYLRFVTCSALLDYPATRSILFLRLRCPLPSPLKSTPLLHLAASQRFTSAFTTSKPKSGGYDNFNPLERVVRPKGRGVGKEQLTLPYQEAVKTVGR